MKLYFKDKSNKEHFICESDTKEEIWKEIRYRTQNSLRPIYTRMWTENNRIWMDYGSWSEFFIVEGTTINDLISEGQGG